MKYEYEILKEATDEELSSRGQDGWRVVQVMFRSDSYPYGQMDRVLIERATDSGNVATEE